MRLCSADFIWSDPRRRAGKLPVSLRCCSIRQCTDGKLFWITRADSMTTTRRRALLLTLGFAVWQGSRLSGQAKMNPELEQALSLPDFESLAHKHISHGA